MDGLAVGLACYRVAGEAASAACASISGPTSGGVVSCESASVVGGVFSYTLNVDSGAGRTSRAVSVALPECVPVDLVEWGPVIAAWFLALVVLHAARSVYTRTFGRETS